MQLTDFGIEERFLFEDVPCEKIDNVEIISTSGRLELYGSDEFFFRSRDANFTFKITDVSQKIAVKDCLARKFIGLAAVTVSPKNDEKFFCLRIIFFMRAVHFGHFQIILGNAVREKLREKNFDVAEYESISKIFQFVDGASNENCFAFAVTLPPREEISAATKKVLQIEGNDCRILVRLEGEDFDSRATAYQIFFGKHENKNETLALQLAYGKIEFSKEPSFISKRVREIFQETPNYISIWNEYADREGDFLLRHARAVGEISYLPTFNQTAEGIALTLIDDGKFDLSWLAVGDYLEVRNEPPPYIADMKMTWQDYQAWKMQAVKKFSAHFEIVKILDGVLILKADENFPAKGKLYFSIYGNEKQIETRMEARRRIEAGTSAMPNLGLILGRQTSFEIFEQKRQYISPRSALLNQKIFSHEPTPKQIQAIDAALNTPDIAVIQGPPGTGKTTVITAILERLNEISDKTNLQAGKVLITGLQHDAVENVIGKIKINSLPVIKFGKRANAEDLTAEIQFNEWYAEILKKLEAKHPALKQTEKERRLFELFNNYIQAPSNSKALDFLKTARTFVREKFLLKAVDEIISQLEPLKTYETDELLKKIYRLPTTPNEFADGGQEILIDLFNELEKISDMHPAEFQKKFLATLRKAALADAIDEKILLELSRLKQELLLRCTQSPISEPQEVRADVTEIYTQIKKSLARPQDAADNIIYNFYRELRENPQAVRRAVFSYNFAFAATAQQSDRSEIKLAKNVQNPYDEKSHAEYETVIVDEAARITPGDLLIPLSQASRRIILVGDQRQLPHIYNEEIFRALREEGQFENEDDFKTSMFEYLWKKAQELERADGIKRAITLDAQYRMHPLLGNFVSENFYAPYNAAFRSPRPASEFVQEICPSPVCWVNIPATRGKDSRSNSHSLYRTCEIEYIAEKLSACLADPKNENLSFGVISFYRAQVQAIKNRLKDFGARVRIGTVDEFQGMEFDIIFLSVVRSGKNFSEADLKFLENPPSESDKENFNEYKKIRDKIGEKIYGFLNVENRLCVALSRQKRLLIVVGDADMFCSKISARVAKICVPAMYNFYKLCENERSVVNA